MPGTKHERCQPRTQAAVVVCVAAFLALAGWLESPISGNARRSRNAGGDADLTISPTALPEGQMLFLYQAKLAVSGGVAPYSWHLASGRLPPGLTLEAASGVIGGTPVQQGEFKFTMQVQDSSRPTPQTVRERLKIIIGNKSVDRYGGLLEVSSPRGATGRWRVEKFKNHWMFVTPDGHAFWSFGVFAVGPARNYLTKYPNKGTWGSQTVTRLKSWGFNTLLDHSDDWTMPTSSPVKTPAVFFFRGDNWPIRNVDNYLPAGTNAKDIFQGFFLMHSLFLIAMAMAEVPIPMSSSPQYRLHLHVVPSYLENLSRF